MAGHDAIDGGKVQIGSDDLVIGSSGDLKKPFTAESAEKALNPKGRKERMTTQDTAEHRVIGSPGHRASGDLKKPFTVRERRTDSSALSARRTLNFS